MRYFDVMLQATADALLMSEETMNFYQYNRKIRPEEVSHFAISYMLTLLNVLLKYNKDVYVELSKTIKKAATDYCPLYKQRVGNDSRAG